MGFLEKYQRLIIGTIVLLTFLLVIVLSMLPKNDGKENFHPLEHEVIDTVPVEDLKAEAYNKTEEDKSYERVEPTKTSDAVFLCDQNTGHCITHD